MNKYLEKIAGFTKEALNAFKAREMAKKVGVIADPSSAWKWGLRQLRDGRGAPLQGSALEKARTGIGAMSSEGFDKLRRAQASNPNKEMGYSTLGGNVSGIHRGREHGITVDVKRALQGNQDAYVGHTHHGVGIDTSDFKANPHRITIPSGVHEHLDIDNYKATGGGGRVVKKRIEDASYSTRLRQGLQSDIIKGNLSPSEAGGIWGKYSPKTLSVGNQGRDVNHSILYPNKVVNNVYRISNRSISNTTQGVEGLHRSVGVYNGGADEAHLLKHRTVFLKHE